MRKIISLFMFMFLLILVGCSNDSELKTTTQENAEELNSITLNDNQSIAFSAYLSSGILSSVSDEASISNIMFNQTKVNALFLSETTTEEELLEVESDLDVVNIYFDKLKVFMDNGVDSTLTIQEEESTNEAYEKQVTYTIEGVTYTLYYSYINNEEQDTEETTTETETTTEETTTTTETETTTEETTTTETETTTTETETTTEETTTTDDESYDRFHIIGLMIIDEVEYELEGYSVLENGEEKIFFETIERENSSNYVRVQIKYEEGMQKFDLVSVIDGVTKRSDIKLTQEEENVKVQLRLFDGEVMSSYQFKKIVEEDTTLYMLNYKVGNTKGVIKIFVTTDENGEIVYRYQINEGGKSKQVEKGKSKGKNKNKDNHRNTSI